MAAIKYKDYRHLDDESRRVCIQLFQNRGWTLPPALVTSAGHRGSAEEFTLIKAIDYCLSDPEVARKSLEILTGRARIKRTMWSRRAQEYEAKINSGDINAIAEVVRDLYRSEAQPEQSYSERQLYEAALDRIMREIAAVQKLSEIDALKLIESHLKKSQRRAAKADGVESDEAAVEEAA